MTVTYICDTHAEYPKRLNPHNYFYTEYKDKRPFFFHDVLLSPFTPSWSDPLVPSIDDFKEKISYITNDYILNSLFFEYCDYYIYCYDGEDYASAMLPCNPYGPTGIGGRGLLGKWGPNQAADPVVITYDTTREIYQLLVIERSDKPGIWALPGGMQDTNECISTTVTRELKEETNLILDIENSKFIYSGYVNDPRNTDNAWMETSVYLFVLDEEQRKILLKTIQAGDDAINVKLTDLCSENTEYTNLYANHKEFVDYALKLI